MTAFVVPLLLVAGGIVLLMAGGDRLVVHAAHLARSYRVPKTVVGAVVIGFGTSLPELVVSLDAAFRGSPGITIGNVVGSNIANVGLILGSAAVLASLHVQRIVLRVDLPLGVLAALFLILWVGPKGEVSRETGVVLLAAFAFYLYVALRHTMEHRAGTEDEEGVPRTPRRDLLWILAGLAGVVGGAHLLVGGAVEIARLLEVDETVIGLTLVAVGTSIPELAATLAAARRREAELLVGNIAGSNLFNVLFILGLAGVLRPIPVTPAMPARDFPALAVFSVLAFPLLTVARRIRRGQGLALLLAYGAYVTWLVRAPS